jgi:hypothetical protein
VSAAVVMQQCLATVRGGDVFGRVSAVKA